MLPYQSLGKEDWLGWCRQCLGHNWLRRCRCLNQHRLPLHWVSLHGNREGMVQRLHWRSDREGDHLGMCHGWSWLGSCSWDGLRWPPWLGGRPQQGTRLKLLGKEQLWRLQQLRQQRLLLLLLGWQP